MSTPARNSGEGPGRHRLLGIYLNDHLAGATAGVELAHRMVHEHGDSAYGGELRGLAAEISHDRRALLRLMAELNVPTRRYKVYGAWLGEKLARAKPNGRLLRRSGLTVLVELEALRTGVAGKAMLWHSLLSASVEDPRLGTARLEELLRRAERQLTVMDTLHTRAASTLLSSPTSGRQALQAVPQGTAGPDR